MPQSYVGVDVLGIIIQTALLIAFQYDPSLGNYEEMLDNEIHSYYQI